MTITIAAVRDTYTGEADIVIVWHMQKDFQAMGLTESLHTFPLEIPLQGLIYRGGGAGEG